MDFSLLQQERAIELAVAPGLLQHVNDCFGKQLQTRCAQRAAFKENFVKTDLLKILCVSL
jgi:hypothetical protein